MLVKRSENFFRFLAIGIITAAFMFPIYWLFITSFKKIQDIQVSPPHFLPTLWNFSNYSDTLSMYPVPQFILNSIVVSLTVVGICVFIGSLGGYGLSRFPFIGSQVFLLLLVSVRMIPPISLTTSFYLVFNWLRWIDTKKALMASYIFLNLPFAVWIMEKFFRSVPRELDDAARLDGCGRLQTFFRIALPLSAPGLAAVAVICLLWSWNEFLYALCFTYRTSTKTITVGSYDFIADSFFSYNLLGATGVMAGIPGILIVIFFQKFIVSGLATGAVKG